ncbi:MAG: CHRD domain-containing protein [Actinomycetota bacterium]|nr:CHRD domain-containing protein [Actinomycetota bacterium]
MGARSGWRTVPRPAVVAAAVSIILAAAVVAAGSARLLPGPTQDVVANIVRTVTPFGFPEQREPEPVLPKAPGASTAAPSDDPDTRAGVDSSPPGPGQPGTNETAPAGPVGADGPQPNRVDAAPRPAAPPAPRAAPAAPGPNGGPSQGTATDPAPPSPPKPPDFKANLSGATGTSAAGDPDGRGAAFVDARPGRDELCLTLVVSGTAPLTSAHLHAGDVGVSGPVVAAFGESAAGPSGQCVAVSHQVIKEIRKDPAKYYVDVHTAEFPDEALRGQLAP